MYLRKDHVDTSIPALRDLMNQNPLGILTTAIESDQYPLIQASHNPWVIDVDDPEDEQCLPRLRGHIARNNPKPKP